MARRTVTSDIRRTYISDRDESAERDAATQYRMASILSRSKRIINKRNVARGKRKKKAKQKK